MIRAAIAVWTKHKTKLKPKTVENVINKYFGTLTKLMAQGQQDSVISFPYRFEFPEIGHIRYNPGVLRRRYEHHIDREIDYDAARASVEYVLFHGWRLFMWTIKFGYIFRHEKTGTLYYLKNETIRGKLDAYQHFSEIVDTDYVWTNTPVNILEPFKLITPLTCHGYKAYTEFGTLVQEYSTLEYAAKAANAPRNVILALCLYNKGLEPRYHKLFKDHIWKFGNEIYPKRYYGVDKIHIDKTADRVDLYDYKTGKLLYKNFGYIGDVVVMLTLMRKRKVQNSNIKRALRTGNSAYGYGFKKSSKTLNRK